MKTLTVITTTYNRAYCIHQVYDSLINQKCKDFIWLVIDDGSTDNTRELIQNYINENKIEIEYYYKPNGGMHTARNMAYDKAHTEINMIIDSDDWVSDNAIQLIIDFWNKYKRDDIAGIITLNADKSGKIIGTKAPDSLIECHFTDYWNKYHARGDKKLVYRTDLTKQYPYPEFEGEKFYPASYKFIMIDQDYKMLVMNRVTCIVDYNQDSMTFNKYSQYKNCAKGFAHYRNEIIRVSKDNKVIIKEMIHYLAEAKFAGDKNIIKNSSKPLYALVCYPIGLIYYYFLKNTKKLY